MRNLLLAIFLMLLQANHALFADTEYTIGIEDVLEINILQPEKLSLTVTVSPDGSISFPYIGDVRVKGLTLKQIQDEIEKKLSDGYMKYPLLTVFLKESRSRKFFVYGDVAKPGSYPIEQDTTILKAISIAGGFTKNGLSTNLKVLRPKQDNTGIQTIKINIRDILQGSAGADMPLSPQDTIIVSEEKFFVYGDVAKPGVYPMDEDMTVLKAISIAGGVLKPGSLTRISVLRPKDGGGSSETIEVNIREAMRGGSAQDLKLLPQDTIMVSQGKFFVYGEVNTPGVYPMEEDTTVLKAIAIAGGFTKFGSSSRVKVLRPKDGSGGYETIPVNIKEVMAGSSENDIILKPGDTVVVLEGII